MHAQKLFRRIYSSQKSAEKTHIHHGIIIAGGIYFQLFSYSPTQSTQPTQKRNIAQNRNSTYLDIYYASLNQSTTPEKFSHLCSKRWFLIVILIRHRWQTALDGRLRGGEKSRVEKPGAGDLHQGGNIQESI